MRRGSVVWQGTDIAQLNDAKRVALRRQTIGVVYQFHHLLPEFSAEENVALPAILGGQRWLHRHSWLFQLLIRLVWASIRSSAWRIVW